MLTGMKANVPSAMTLILKKSMKRKQELIFSFKIRVVECYHVICLSGK